MLVTLGTRTDAHSLRSQGGDKIKIRLLVKVVTTVRHNNNYRLLHYVQ